MPFWLFEISINFFAMSITSPTAQVNVNNVSGHYMGHRNSLTAKCGTLVPILTEEVCPNTRCHLKTSFSVKLPPLASETFANIDYRIEAFFVPHRLLVGGFDRLIAGMNKSLPSGFIPVYLPVLDLNPRSEAVASFDAAFAPGTLADYLGFKKTKGFSFTASTHYRISPLPFLAYHKIYDFWYRNKLVQKPVFAPVNGSSVVRKFFTEGSAFNETNYIVTVNSNLESSNMVGHDGVGIFSLRQRNFDADYFTTATLSPQLGAANSVSISVAENVGSMSIASLRAANSLQQFAERNNLCGVEDVNYYRAMYGAHLDYGVAQHPVCLGSASVPIYVNGVFQNGENKSAGNNPFMSVATQYGSATSASTEVIIKDFTAQEFGYIMVLGSLVPRVSYSSGNRRYLFHHIRSDNYLGTDFANPLLQNVGPQPIYRGELASPDLLNSTGVFGYQQRYAEWISHPDEVHGEFVDGQSLDSFVLQRSFVDNQSETLGINSSFLQIPTNYLDQIFASSSELYGGFSYWVDMLHSWKISSPISDFVLPSLQDPAYEHGHSVTVNKNGQPPINK